jgi:CheY-like chemotaxis protein
MKTRILIIEDDKGTFDNIVKEFFDKEKYEVVNDETKLENSIFISNLYSVINGNHTEKLITFLNDLGKIDLIVLDYFLKPGFEDYNGLDILKILQNNHSLFLNSNFILLTQIDSLKFNEILGSKLLEYFKYQKWIPFFKDQSSNLSINHDQFRKAVSYLTNKKHFEVFIGYASEDLPNLGVFKSNLETRSK